MNPAPPDSSEPPAPPRQQLILAQVRLLELTDAREALTTRLALLERLLTEAQALANAKIAERDHGAKVAAGLEEQAGRLNAELAAVQAALQQRQTRVTELQALLGAAEQSAADRLARIGELEATVRAMKSSRSWRWTAPLRTLGKLFSGS